MTGCTHDGNTIPVVAPKDAEGRDVPLDTEAMYDGKGVKYDVCGLIFRSMTEICDAGWTVELTTAENKVRQISLNYMYLEKPDSWEALEQDMDRCSTSTRYAPCAYFDESSDGCEKCIADPNKECLVQLVKHIALRIRTLRGEGE